MKKYNTFNKEKMETTFNVTLGRAFYGFQKFCYSLANKLDLTININKLPSILTVTYIIKLNGDYDNIKLFIDTLNRSVLNKNDKNEYEEG